LVSSQEMIFPRVLTSPFEAFARFESEHGPSAHRTRRTNDETFCVRVALSKSKLIDPVAAI
jgi:hypothetical protein